MMRTFAGGTLVRAGAGALSVRAPRSARFAQVLYVHAAATLRLVVSALFTERTKQ